MTYALSIPDDLITEILVRLLVRTLVQLRRVCKSWKTVINGVDFAKSHLQRSTMDPNLTVLRLAYTIPRYNTGFYTLQSLLDKNIPPHQVVYSPPTVSHQQKIIGSCNGLLCMHDIQKDLIRIWNPCSGSESEWLGIEPCVPIKMEHYGFGYDHVHDKYKFLVIIHKHGVINSTVTKVYTFGQNSWKIVDNFSLHPRDRVAKFLRGTLNWISEQHKSSNNPNKDWVILSFNLVNDSHGRVSLPCGYDETTIGCRAVLQVLKDCLFVCVEKSMHSHEWVLWLMKEYGVEESWTKLTVIPHIKSIPYNYNALQPLYISGNNEQVLFTTSFQSELALYNSRDAEDTTNDDEKSSVLWTINLASSNIITRYYIYYENLVSLSHYYAIRT